MEHQIVIPKVTNPETKDDMRNLGLSPFFNKGLEWILVQWLLPYVEKYLMRDQLGGQPGCATVHYLARFVDFIYAELEKGTQKDRRGVLAMSVDLAKAFNRLDHNKLLTLLFDMGVPPCALRLLGSYLQGRKMEVHLGNVKSHIFELWGVAHKVGC